MKLDTKIYDEMFEQVAPILKTGRPGDYQHIKSLYQKLVADYESEKLKFNPRIMLPAAILHDVGFGFIKTKYMRMFTGNKKIPIMKKAAEELAPAYAQVMLKDNFSVEETEQIIHIICHSDENSIDPSTASHELLLLHDLNLFDRLLPHRLSTMRVLYPDREKRIEILEDGISEMILPEIKKEAQELMKTITV